MGNHVCKDRLPHGSNELPPLSWFLVVLLVFGCSCELWYAWYVSPPLSLGEMLPHFFEKIISGVYMIFTQLT